MTSQSICCLLKLSKDDTELSPPNRDVTAEKRKRILDAAVKVFARKGYHGSRVSDIAKEAEIAYGLVYHYFKSKEEILLSIFRERWSTLVSWVETVADGDDPVEKKLYDIASFIIDSYRFRPELVEVITLEVTRNSRFFTQENVKLLQGVFDAMDRIISEGKAGGLFKDHIDPRLASYIFFGGIETLINGYVLETLIKTDEDFEQAKKTVVEVFLHGLSAGSKTA